MRTITTTTNLYKYDELNVDAQEKVKQWYLDNFCEPAVFSDMVTEDLEVIFGKNDLDVEYSLGYCQGDGLNIYGNISVNQILDAAEKNENGISLLDDFNKMLSEKDKKAVREYANYYHMAHVPENNTRYSYCISDQIDYACDCEIELERVGIKNIDTIALVNFNDALIHLFKELCNMYEEMGYDYFYNVEEDYLSNECDNNGWWFTEDGELYNA